MHTSESRHSFSICSLTALAADLDGGRAMPMAAGAAAESCADLESGGSPSDPLLDGEAARSDEALAATPMQLPY